MIRTQSKDIAFISPSVHSGSASLLWPSMALEARKSGHRLFIFSGGRLQFSDPSQHRKNRIYSLVTPGTFHGCISWTSALAGTVSEEAVRAYHARFAGMPLVSVGLELPGCMSITLDVYGGMRRLLEHLSHDHGARRFAFLRGPLEHRSAQERYQAFRDFIRDEGLDETEQWASPPVLWTQGGEAVRTLVLEEDRFPRRDFDALVGTSDLMVYNGVLALQELGYVPVRDFIAGGFNDSPESRLLNPNFTTVHMPFGEAGQQAFLRVIGEAEGNFVLTPRLIIRRSCGCFQHARDLVPPPAVETMRIDDPRFFRLLASDMLVQIQGGEEELTAWIEPLAQALISGLEEGPGRGFLSTLDGVLERVVNHRMPVHVWQDLLTAAHIRCRFLDPPIDADTLDLLFERARLVVSDSMENTAALNAWQDRLIYQELQTFEHRLLGLSDFPAFSQTLLGTLPSIGIEGCWVVLYADEGSVLSAGFARDSVVDVPVPVSAGDFLPPQVFAVLEPGATFFVLPLLDEDLEYGYAVLELGVERAEVYEQIRTALTGAVRGILLYRRLREAGEAARRAEETKTHFLANASRELHEPLDRIRSSFKNLVATEKAARNGGIASVFGKISKDLETLSLLTKDLADLSRSQTDDLVMEFRAVDLSGLFDTKTAGISFSSGPDAADLPLIDADPQRLLQILEGFAHLLRVQADAKEVVGSLGIEQRGIRIELSIPMHTPRFIDEEQINWTLYRKILTMHGGSVSQVIRGRELCVSLSIPFPCFGSEYGADDAAEGFAFVAPVPGRGEPDASDPAQTGSSYRSAADRIAAWPVACVPKAYEEIFGCGPDEVGGITLDMERAGPADWAFVARLHRTPGFSRVPLAVFPAGSDRLGLEFCTGGKQPVESLRTADYLLSKAGIRGVGPAVVFLDTSDRAEEFRVPEIIGSDVLWLRKWEDLSILDDTNPPKIFILGRADIELAERIREKSVWGTVPILILARQFTGIADSARIDDFLRLMLLHRGVYSQDELADRLEYIMNSEHLLPPQTGNLVKRAILYLDRHFAQGVSRWKMAESVHVSEDYLTRIFHKEMGLSPWEYLNRLRIAKGAELLRATADSVQEISERIGFTDQAYFCRVFRKVMGVTPSRYRVSGEVL